jgi:hypothetical protein
LFYLYSYFSGQSGINIEVFGKLPRSVAVDEFNNDGKQDSGLRFLQRVAFERDQDAALMVNIIRNDQPLSTIKVCNYDADLPRYSLPREGFVGSQYAFESKCREDDQITVKTGEQIKKCFQIRKGSFVLFHPRKKNSEKV